MWGVATLQEGLAPSSLSEDPIPQLIPGMFTVAQAHRGPWPGGPGSGWPLSLVGSEEEAGVVVCSPHDR